MLLTKRPAKNGQATAARRPIVYGYPRVSTDEQTQSIDVQLDLIKKRAALITDTDWGGAEPEQESASKIRYYDRPVFSRLLNKLKPGDTLIVSRLDRLERGMFAMVEVLNVLVQRQVHVIALQFLGGNELDLNSVTGKILAMFLAGLAEMENAQRTETFMAAKRWRKERGLQHNRLPFGFRAIPLPMKPGQKKPLKMVVPTNLAVVEEIITRIDNGEPVSEIARDFSRRGIQWHSKQWAPYYPYCRLYGTRRILCAYRFWKYSPLRGAKEPATLADEKATEPGASSCPSADDL
jgi:DNA invertase Pin-like site-specific DNA recombinase